MVQYYYDRYTAEIESTIISYTWGPSYTFDAVEQPITGAPRIERFEIYTYEDGRKTGSFILPQEDGSIGGFSSVGAVSYEKNAMSFNPTIVHSVRRWTITKSGFPFGARFEDTMQVNTHTYKRGALLSSNIVANESAYYSGARNDDGYWYERRAMLNTAPSIPAAFTQPSGELEIGDVKTVSWNSSSDAEGNLSKYVLEASINSGSYAVIGQPTSPSFNYTIPTATTVKFRVKAVDTAGLESGYRESSAFVVTKPKYYWSKYNSAYRYTDADWQLIGPLSLSTRSSESSKTAVPSYSFDSQLNKYIESGTRDTLANLSSGYGDGTGRGAPYTVYAPGVSYYNNILSNYYPEPNENNGIVRFDINDYYNETSNGYASGIVYQKKPSLNTLQYYAENLVQSGIAALADTYPVNGRHTDGFWYIRGSRVNQSIVPPGGFANPANGTVLLPGAITSLSFASSSALNLSLYEVDYKEGANAWTALTYNNTLSRSYTVTTNKTLITVQFRVRAKNTSSVYSDYVYSDTFTIQHNVTPTINGVKLNDSAILNGGDLLIPTKADVVLSFTPSDTDAGDTLQYRVTVNNIEKVAYKSTPTGTAVTYTIPAADVMTGMNPVWVYVKDASGAIASYQVTIRNKGPSSYSLREVHGVIVQFIAGGSV